MWRAVLLQAIALSIILARFGIKLSHAGVRREGDNDPLREAPPISKMLRGMRGGAGGTAAPFHPGSGRHRQPPNVSARISTEPHLFLTYFRHGRNTCRPRCLTSPVCPVSHPFLSGQLLARRPARSACGHQSYG